MTDKIKKLLIIGMEQPSLDDATIFFENAYLLRKAHQERDPEQIIKQEGNAFKNIYSLPPKMEILTPLNLGMKYSLENLEDSGDYPDGFLDAWDL